MLAASTLLLACGGGGGGGTAPAPPPPPPPPPPPAPATPVADAGPDQTVQEMTVVNLSGSATDANGDPITYMWVQIAGTMVTLDTPDSASASFTAPDVAVGNPEVLTFELTVSDPGGLSSTDSIDITVEESAGPVTISGTLLYEFPPPNPGCVGLNFSVSAIQERPIRQATVQLLDSTGTTVLDTDVSNDLGQYSVTVGPQTSVMIRVLAQSVRAGAMSWDIEIRNNVDTSGNPPPLDQRPIYAMDSSVFDSGTSSQTRSLTATTGWGTSSYIEPRVAAPFAILDAIYSATLFVGTEDPNVEFPPLDAFWSPDNKITSPSDLDQGDLSTSFYNGQQQLFLVGADGEDTDEFDEMIVVHEWGHFFEDTLSRSDSIGGTHFIGSDLLDKRVAFGEGFANALAGMALDNPIYCDTSWLGANQAGFDVNLEEESTQQEGWYDEVSIFEILYDLWDTDNDGADNDSIGFGPIYNVMRGNQVTSPAFTSIFSFATYLKQANSGDAAFIDALLIDHNIQSNIDIYGSTETNDGPGTPQDVFPLYTDITLGVTTNICVNDSFDTDRDGNKLAEHRYLRFNVPSSQNVSFSMITTDADGNAPSQPSSGFDCTADPDDSENHEHSDPDLLVSRHGEFSAWGQSCEPNSETTQDFFLQAGDYIIDVHDWRHSDSDATAEYPERICFDFTAN